MKKIFILIIFWSQKDAYKEVEIQTNTSICKNIFNNNNNNFCFFAEIFLESRYRFMKNIVDDYLYVANYVEKLITRKCFECG